MWLNSHDLGEYRRRRFRPRTVKGVQCLWPLHSPSRCQTDHIQRLNIHYAVPSFWTQGLALGQKHVAGKHKELAPSPQSAL